MFSELGVLPYRVTISNVIVNTTIYINIQYQLFQKKKHVILHVYPSSVS
jgi:hypothetical protein